MKNTKNKAGKRVVKGWQMKWVYGMGIVIVVGGVMAFGLIGYYAYDMKREGALPMIYMILPLIIVYTIAIRGALSGMEERIHRLSDGIGAVTQGDLDYRIELKDAEEYRSLYEGFNRMAEELSHTRQEMEDFTNTFAHEFKTPITSINGFAELLLEKWEVIDEKERQEYLTMIAEQSRRLSDLSKNTLLLSKVNAMQIVTNRERYNLTEQIRGCVILFLQEMEKKDIGVELPEDEDLWYYANPGLLEHVWINLLSNAVKYTGEGGRIRITQQESDVDVKITISDTGVGMDEVTRAHIYEKYFRKDTAASPSGNGIGLAVVAGIISLCGGNVAVESTPGEGSSFTVTLKKEADKV